MGGNIFSLEELVCKKMSSKPKHMKPANEENKQFDRGRRGGEPPFRKADVLVLFSFSEGCMGLDARLVSFAFACLSVVCLFRFVFLLQLNEVIIFLQTEEYVEGEKKTNGDANQVDEERNRR